jgi:predicted N-acetyltransferase YhbS
MTAAPSSPSSVTIEPETAADTLAVLALVAAAFGPGRYAKTAERLRERNAASAGLSFVAREGGRVVGSVRLWPVLIGEAQALFLGPIAVEDSRRRAGLGAQLVERACAEARRAGCKAVLLVGDEPYFGRFGFQRCAAVMPGPVDPRRVLINVLAPGAVFEGPVRAA